MLKTTSSVSDQTYPKWDKKIGWVGRLVVLVAMTVAVIVTLFVVHYYIDIDIRPIQRVEETVICILGIFLPAWFLGPWVAKAAYERNQVYCFSTGIFTAILSLIGFGLFLNLFVYLQNNMGVKSSWGSWLFGGWEPFVSILFFGCLPALGLGILWSLIVWFWIQYHFPQSDSLS